MRVVFFSTNDHDVMNSLDNFSDMVDIAKKNLKGIDPASMSQCVVVRTAKNNLYVRVIKDVETNECIEEKEFLRELKELNDIEFLQIVCMFPEICMTMPSYVFRKMICELHPNNKNAEMILSGEDCYIKKTIAETFPRHIRHTL